MQMQGLKEKVASKFSKLSNNPKAFLRELGNWPAWQSLWNPAVRRLLH